MKKIIITVCVVIIAVLNCQAQKIEREKTFGGYKYSQGGVSLSMNELVSIMGTNSEAYELMKSARSTYTFAQIIGGAGGFMIGWPLGTAIGGGDPNWTLAGIGAGLVVVSIPIYSTSNRKTKQAVDLYNADLAVSSDHNSFNPRFRLAVKGTGLRFVMRF